MIHIDVIVAMGPTELTKSIGDDVQTYCGGVGKLCILDDGGWAIRVYLACQGQDSCSETQVVYLRPGCAGPDHYAYNFSGKYLADLRNRGFDCGKHK